MVSFASRPAPRRRLLAVTALVAVLAALLVAGPSGSAAASTAAAAAPADDGWTLATTSPADAAAAPAYLGNGYVGTRVPADGAGYAETPVATETHAAGVYADKPDVDHGGTQLQGSVNLLGWTQLDGVVAGHHYRAADASAYRQAWTCAGAWSRQPPTWSTRSASTRWPATPSACGSRRPASAARTPSWPSWP
jgi:hypothetical protein